MMDSPLKSLARATARTGLSSHGGARQRASALSRFGAVHSNKRASRRCRVGEARRTDRLAVSGGASPEGNAAAPRSGSKLGVQSISLGPKKPKSTVLTAEEEEGVVAFRRH